MNLRPSGYEPDELPGCSTPRNRPTESVARRGVGRDHPGRLGIVRGYRVGGLAGWGMPGWPGSGLLSRALWHSTMGAAGFHGRVRDGIGWFTRAGPPGHLGILVGTPAYCRWAVAGVVGRVRTARRRWGEGIPGTGMIGRPAACLVAAPGLGRGEHARAIRTGRLRALPRFDLRPIDVVVYHGSDGETWFGGGFPA